MPGESPKNSENDQAIRQRAHEIWDREGRPVSRHEEHWRMAEQELAAATSDSNEGEGNKMAALAFDGNQAAFAKKADVEGLAIAARDALDGAEGAQLRKAEEEGKARSPGEDRQLSKKPAARDV
jgi:hypothetical protein